MQSTLNWGHAALAVSLSVDADNAVRITRLARPDDDADKPGSAAPLIEITALGQGNGWNGPGFLSSPITSRLRYRSHRADRDGAWHRLRIELVDPQSQLTAELVLSSPDGVPVVRAEVSLQNNGPQPIVLSSVSSLLLGGLPSPDTLQVHRARNDWLAECRWFTEPLRDHTPDIHRPLNDHSTAARLTVSSRGSWPTDGHLAMGALSDTVDGRTWLWQIDSTVAWRWCTGEYEGSAYLALSGPTDAEHHWRQRLSPGETFQTEPAVLALGSGFDDAMGALTTYRRAVRRPHPDHIALPVIYNDFMNTLMGDPTTEKLLPLIDAAAAVGAEYFCVDAGWYDDDAQGWWDSVGEWEPAESRFPDGGLTAVLGHIRHRGMVPGLWLEPEVVGVRSPIAQSLPDEAFVQQDGVRVTEHGRHHLDLRHPAARAHLDAVVDRVVGDWGVGYLKLDYNITISGGGGPILGHGRLWIDWLSSLHDRYPGLVIENCASGGMRMEGASSRVTQLQSTSDQMDYLLYPTIAAAAPTVVPPEQGAVWAYAQPHFSDEENFFVLGNALLGRMHLSGFLDRMTESQLASVRQVLDTYKELRTDLPQARPFWPLGLPAWTDSSVALGLQTDKVTYLSVWRRDGAADCRLPVQHLTGRDVRPVILHASSPSTTVTLNADHLQVSFEANATTAYVLIKLAHDQQPSESTS
ncbi:alpha-galactosidase [Streptomyces sp. NPDC059786]|uniref:alpha-galactosidase n=1 Tax=Streptomyces sp. NPDC059786 TaxID=3346946 RepID=UPI003646DA08